MTTYSTFTFSAVLLAALLCGATAQPRGVYVSVEGVENLNLTLTAAGVKAGETSSGQVCVVGDVPEPFKYYPTDNAPPVDGPDAENPIAYIYVSVALGSFGTVTFHGGDLGSAESTAEPVTTVTNSSDAGKATGPLYVTRREVAPGQESMDLAQFFPTMAGQTAYLAGGLASIGSGPVCNYNISFTASAR